MGLLLVVVGDCLVRWSRGVLKPSAESLAAPAPATLV
jgi:hypothetical protein